MEDTLAFYGGAVKALGGGKIAGYGILFTSATDPDLQGEVFTKETDLELEIGDRRSIYYRHGSHPIIKDRKLGKATLTMKDDAGAFFEGELNLRDDYERYIYKLAEMGKLGWSTGSMPHLVRKELMVDGKHKAMALKSWPIGEISLTPSPVEPRTSAFPVKSLEPGETDELDAFIKSEEEPPFDIAGTPALKAFCEIVAPNGQGDGSQRSASAAHAGKEFITIARIYGEALQSYTGRLVRRSEHRFLKDKKAIDASTVSQVTELLADIERFEVAKDSVKESLLGIKKIADLTTAEQKAMDEKAKFALWNYYRISGYKPEELSDGRTTG
jgi:hypothetical protein